MAKIYRLNEMEAAGLIEGDALSLLPEEYEAPVTWYANKYPNIEPAIAAARYVKMRDEMSQEDIVENFPGIESAVTLRKAKKEMNLELIREFEEYAGALDEDMKQFCQYKMASTWGSEIIPPEVMARAAKATRGGEELSNVAEEYNFGSGYSGREIISFIGEVRGMIEFARKKDDGKDNLQLSHEIVSSNWRLDSEVLEEEGLSELREM